VADEYKVRITGRNFTYGSKIFGTGGEYTVNLNAARYIVNNGKGTLLEGELPEEYDPATAAINDGQFMSAVRRNALAIAQILSQAIENESTDADTATSSESESGGAKDTSDDDSEIPEDFPGREVLINAGIVNVASIPTSKDELMAVEGMTAKLATQIGVKLAKG
jgi:hypothetical protein